MKPVLIISDTHYHNFHLYASEDHRGINSRLSDILRATAEAVKALKEAGGDAIIHCGDVFHVRGEIDPTVLNPVMNFYKNLVDSGFKVYMISGNHDLKTNDANAFASSVTALSKVGVRVFNEPEAVMIDGSEWVFVPWFSDLGALRHIAKTILPLHKPGEPLPDTRNLVIHAPLNGVIEGLPDHGLTPKDFDGLGYDNVFCGHYHNHKMFVTPDGHTHVYSVGALTHQNWGDVGSRAGFILYAPDEDGGEFSQRPTSAPKFMRVSAVDILTADVTDNYIKVTDCDDMDPAEIELIRADLIVKGAKGVLIEGVAKRPAVTRTSTTKGAPTLQTILGDYIDRNYPGDTDVKLMALDILGEVYD